MNKLGFVACSIFLLTGCWNVLGDLEGDKTRGEEGVSEWWLSDGLCPGLVGECALDTPLAIDASPAIVMRGEERSLAGYELAGDGAISVGPTTLTLRDEEDDDSRDELRADLGAIDVGPGTIRFMRGAEDLDRVSVEVAEPAAIECGANNGGELLYTMEDIQFSSTIELELNPEDAQNQLVCRVTDASGRALLTVRAIQWELLSGSEVLLLDSDEIFVSPGQFASGARILVQTNAIGTARVRASIGSVSTEFDVVVGS